MIGLEHFNFIVNKVKKDGRFSFEAYTKAEIQQIYATMLACEMKVVFHETENVIYTYIAE